MSNQKLKIIYSLRIHTLLQAQGFEYITEMKNPKNAEFTCWVYPESSELLAAFDAALKGGPHDD